MNFESSRSTKLPQLRAKIAKMNQDVHKMSTDDPKMGRHGLKRIPR